MGLEEEVSELVKKKDKKFKEKSEKGKKDGVSDKGIQEPEHRGKDDGIDSGISAEKENGERGVNERKKKKKTMESKEVIEDHDDCYGVKERRNVIKKESEIVGENNRDGNVLENVERKKRKSGKDKMRVSDNQIQEKDCEGKSMNGEGHKELQIDGDVEAVGQAVIDLKKMKKKSKKPEVDLGFGAVQEDRTDLGEHETHENNNQRREVVEAIGEGHYLESVEKRTKRKKRKREKDKSVASEDELQGNNDAGGKSHSSADETCELQNVTDTEVIVHASDGDDVVDDGKKKKRKKTSKKPEADLGPVQQERRDLGTCETDENYNQRKEVVEVIGEIHHSESVEKKKKGKKRKREWDKRVASEDELLRPDNDDAGGRSQSVADESCELQKVTDAEAIVQASDGDVVLDDEKKKKKKKKKKKSSKSGEESVTDGCLTEQKIHENEDRREAVEACSEGFKKKGVKKKKRRTMEAQKDISGLGSLAEGCTEGNTDLELDSNLKNGTEGERELARSVVKDPKSKKGKKKVTFSGKDEVFPLPKVVHGKRFSKEEDEMVKAAVFKYIEAHCLGEAGLKMVLNCKSHPEVRGCWKEIGVALPHRPQSAVYYRAQILFRRDEKRKWTKEDIEILRVSQKKNGNKWKDLADELGKHRFHVKDTWRRIRHANLNKGHWNQEEYQTLFDLVNTDLRLKYSEEKKSKHGMLRDNIPWSAISDKLTTRTDATCCLKWYNQLASPMVEEGEWADSDDYRLIDALFQLDANCLEDVEWDDLLDHRSGVVCRKRWNEMLLHIGDIVSRPFADQVEVLAKRYCSELLEARETWESKPYVP